MENILTKKKILLVDDDTIFQDVVISMLSDKYCVVAAKSGSDALVMLIKDKPDLILLDIIMPEMSGWETFHKIRGISLLQHVPIAFITTISETEGINEAVRLGASDYLKKPLKRIDFLDRIEKILNGEKLIGA